jgi:signal transduction histidine kinase/ActR/RegA family two-component response regulator
VASKFNSWRHAKKYIDRGFLAVEVPALVWQMVGLNAIHGVIWGGLAWVALGTATVGGSVLVLAALTGAIANSMAMFSPVYPAFVAFVLTGGVVSGSKLFLLQDEAYTALAFAGALYMLIMLGQGLASGRCARASIDLQLANADLLEKLRIETAAAQVARQQAERADIAKSRFLAAASHDLRQPVHALGLLLGVLSRTQLTAQQQELLQAARSASDASGGMLNKLLDFSRVEAGVITPQIHPFALQPLLNKIEREFAFQADAKGLVYRCRETTLSVLSDIALIELILRNLVSNAVRYTRRGGVLVTCRSRGQQVLIEVWDTGIGIDASRHQQVFQEFYQLGNPGRGRRTGLGLGLAIVNGLTHTLGHSIGLTSIEGRGSRFTLTLPVAEVPYAKPAYGTVRRQLVSLGTANRRVLVIDEDEGVRVAMLKLLNEWGCKCQVVGTLDEALATVGAFVPDLIISDYRFSELHSGILVIAALREALGQPVPALLVTGDTGPDPVSEALENGLALLHKPVSPSQLYQEVVHCASCHQVRSNQSGVASVAGCNEVVTDCLLCD